MATKTLAVQIRDARIAAGLSQQDLADSIGIKNQSAVARWESGEHEPRLAALQRIADATGVELLIAIRPARRR